ncbi:MAG: hypothetical protein AB1546_04560 [bacterium]
MENGRRKMGDGRRLNIILLLPSTILPIYTLCTLHLALCTLIILSASFASEDSKAQTIAPIIASMTDTEGWASGDWRFDIRLNERSLGSYDIKIAHEETGYNISMQSKITSDNEITEITSSGEMTTNLGFRRYERTENRKGKSGKPKITSSAQLDGKIIKVKSQQDGDVAEAKEIEVNSETYAGIPALFAFLKIADLTKPQDFAFQMFNAEGLNIVEVKLQITGGTKKVKSGDRDLDTYIVKATIGSNEMDFYLTEDNEIVQFGVPDFPLIFQRSETDLK